MSELIATNPVPSQGGSPAGYLGQVAPAAVHLEDVSRSFGHVLALDRITTQIPAGTTVALVGPNGAGKSTLLATIAGLVRPTSGSVWVGGHPVDRAGDTAALAGALTHSTMLYDRLSGRENLALHARLHGRPTAQVEAVLHEVDLTDTADRLVGDCSHGTRKRLALARTLLHDPPLLLLDEPFAGLDPASQERLAETLDRLRGSHTIVFSTHDTNRAISGADRVLSLDSGHIVPSPPTSGAAAAADATCGGQSDRASARPTRPAGLLRSAWEVLRKDVTIEVRSRSISTSVLVLAALLATVLGMAFEPLAGSPRAVSGILWVLVVFAALHALARSFDDDFRDDALHGLLLAGADPAGVYLGRVTSTALFLLVIAVTSAATVSVLFAAPALLQLLPRLLVVLVLAAIGLAAVGSVLTLLSRHSRLGETLLPLLFLPLAVPVLLAGVDSVVILLEVGRLDTGWLVVLCAYALGMVAAGGIVFEHAAEG